MKKLFIIFTSLCLYFQAMSQTGTGTTSLVSIGPDGKLKYTPDAKGNIIPDFSGVGYKNGEESIPNISVAKTISPVAGDNTSNIQNAINEVAALPLNANGIRGAVLLKAGTYNINNTITIRSSGIILRGEGNATILMATKTSQYNLISISGSGGASAVTSTSKKIQGAYIPVGAKTFTLPSGHGFVAGDDVMLQRKPNQAWINMLGMNVLSQIPCDDGGCNVDWTPGEYTINYIRKVIAVDGNSVTLDAPNMDVIDSKYAEGFIMKYTWSGKIENVGVEKLYIDSKYTNANDENHGWHAVSFSNSKNCWVNAVEVHHFGYAAVTVNESAAFTSILNCKNIDPVSQTIGGRKYSFNINGQRNLVKNCATNGGRHDYVNGAQTAGPNVFVSSTAANQKADIGPHHRWATGILYDALVGNGSMNSQNRLGYGTGHGWVGGQIMFWNCTASKFIVQSPPNHMSWAIGCKGNVTDKGDLYTGSPCISQSTGNFIAGIPSLYEQQLKDRLNNSNPVPDNLAKGKTAVVSSTESNTTISTVAGNATDGNYSTRWSSLFAEPQWLYVDLGANYEVNRVKITWEAAYAKDYQIELSPDASNWTSLKTITANSTTTNDHIGLSGIGRYVRIYGTARATTYGYSIMELEVYGAPVQSPYTGTAITLPGKIEAENYDLGGQGLAYNDADAANQGGTYRTEGVDIQVTTDAGGGYAIGYTSTGEWLKYMVNVASNGMYNIDFRIASTSATGAIRLEVDGVDVTGTVTLPNTGAWQTWATTTVENISLAAGAHSIRLYVVNAGFNLNYVEVKSAVPNQLPTVTVSVDEDTLTAPASVTVIANASDSDGSVSKVEFYNGTILLGTDATAPYSYIWTNVAAGSYIVTAKVTDDRNGTATSGTVLLFVKAPVSACQPVTASSDDGNIAANVLDNNLSTRWSANGDGQWIQFCMDTIKEISGVQIAFYNGTTRQSIFDIQLSADGFGWTNVMAGSRSSGTSNELETFVFPVQNAKYVRVLGHGNSVNAWNSYTEVKVIIGTIPVNQLPVVAIISPTNNVSYNAPASFTITANASDADGSVSKVEFYNGSTLLSTDLTPPYSFTWSGVAAGNYTITAKATDNVGAVTTSSAVFVKVNTVTSNPCASIPQYKENNGYVAGSKVQNGGKQYQCKPYPYAGWCNGASWAYAPGTGAYWADAWTETGTCSSAKQAMKESIENTVLDNYPNPFTTLTTIEIKVEEGGEVSIVIFDKTGKEVEVLAEGYFSEGNHRFLFDAGKLPADLYMIKFNINDKVFTRKMVKTE